MTLDLKFYLAIFLRRLNVFVLTFALVTAAAVTLAMILPGVYTAEALLMVQSSDIPDQKLAPSAQEADMAKLMDMENRLMTRANLIDVARREGVFPNMENMAPDDIVDAMRAATTVTKNAKRDEATTMTIAFDASRAQVAAAVVNDLVTLVLKQDVDIRNKSVEGAVEFYDQQVKQLNQQLDQLSAKILAFQNENANALPATLNYRMAQATALQSKLDEAGKQVADLQNQKERAIAFFKATGQIASDAANLSPEAKKLIALNEELVQDLAVMSEQHPKVALLKKQIAQLEEIVKSQAQIMGAEGAGGASLIDVQTAEIDRKLAIARQDRDALAQQVTELQLSINQTPSNEITLEALQRDYNNIQAQYNAAVASQSQAQAAQRIEVLSKGQRVTVLESATPPDRVSKPKRALIAVSGAIAGLFAGMAVVFLLELTNRSVRRASDITQAFGITPLVTIPYMRTPADIMRRRSLMAGLLVAAIVLIPGALYLTHVLITPLDLVLHRALGRLGMNV